MSAVIDATTIGQDQQHEAHIRPSSVSRKRFNVVANDASITTAPSTPATVAPVNSKVKFASIKKRTGAGLHSNKKAAIAMIKNPTALKNSNKLEDIDDDDEEVNEEDDEASGGQELEKIGGAGYAKERASSKRNRKSSDAGRRIADPIEDEVK